MGEENNARLLELADLCEKASGPDRELDLAIACTADPMFTQLDECVRERVARLVLQPYSASLDAAMTLAAGHAVLITLSEIKGDGMPHCVFGNPGTSELFEAVADTMPLAMCAAALRARAKGNIS